MVVPRKATPEEQAELDAQLQAFGRGGLDALSFGLADKGVAATKAAVDAAFGGHFSESYGATRAHQIALDRYEETRYPAFRNTGEVLGAVLPLVVTDGLTAGPSAGRIAFQTGRVQGALQSAVRAARPFGAAAGAGAGAGITGQVVSDTLSRHLSSPQTYLADALGGAAGGTATLARSPAAGAAVSAAVGQGAQSLLADQPYDFAAAAKNATAGTYAGLLGHVGGARCSNGLDRRAKGRLGEWLAARTAQILGDEITPLPLGKSRYPGLKVSGGKTIPDLMTSRGPVEAKFGWQAALSPRQTEATQQIPNYLVQHFLPPDIGRITGGLLATSNFARQPGAGDRRDLTQNTDLPEGSDVN